MWFCSGLWREGAAHSPGPVSYTHLDVYKRQVLDDVILEQYTLGDHLITGLEDVLSERTLEVTGDQELADYLATVLGKA